MNLELWKQRTIGKYLKQHPDVSETEINLVMEFLNSHPTLRLDRLSYLQAKEKAKSWHNKKELLNRNLSEGGKVEEIQQLANGFKIVRLLDFDAKAWEGKRMRHCVGGEDYLDHQEIYSLRDKYHVPHCTLEVDGKWVVQINGKENRKVADKYVPYLLNFFRTQQLSFISSETSERVRYAVLPIEEVTFRRQNFIDPKELITNRVVFAPEDTEKLEIKPDSYLKKIIKQYPNFYKAHEQNLTLSEIFNFFIIRKNLVAQQELIKLIGEVSKSFLDRVITQCIRRGNQECLKLYLDMLPSHSDLEDYVDVAVEHQRINALTVLKDRLPPEALSSFSSRIVRCALLFNSFRPISWIMNQDSSCKIVDIHVLDYLRSYVDVDDAVTFLKQIIPLYQSQAKDTFRIFTAAVRHKDLDIIKVLLDANLDNFSPEDQSRILIKTLEHSRLRTFKLLLARGYVVQFDPTDYLGLAAKNGDLELIKLLVSLGAEVANDHYEALHEASCRGYKEIEQYLLQELKKPA